MIQINGGNNEEQRYTDRLLRTGLRDLRRQDRNAHKRQRPAREDRCPVDKTQRGNDHAGNDKLHRLPRGGPKDPLLRPALPRTSLRPGKAPGHLRGLPADGRMPDAGVHRCKQPVRFGKPEAVSRGEVNETGA